jgi:glycosyltransferase involved in cell wall biosynthesis
LSRWLIFVASRQAASDRLRIAHVTSYVIPGLGYEEPYLATHQARHGHDVAIITSNLLYPLGPYSVLSRRFKDRETASGTERMGGFAITRLPAMEIDKRLWLRGLGSALISFRPDVVHCHDLLQLHPFRIASLKSVGRLDCGLVVDDHMHEVFRRRGAVATAFYATFRLIGYPLLARYVDAFCAIAEDTRDYLREHCGVKADVHIMPLGVDTDLFARAPLHSRRHSRAKLGIPDDTFVVVYVGKVIPDKRIEVLGLAVAQLNSLGRPAVGLVVGDADESYLHSLKSNFPHLMVVGGDVHENLPNYYAAADAAAWPAQESMAIFEAMAMGLPVVVADGTGVSRIVEVADAGCSYAIDDPNSLATALSSMDGDFGERLGSQGRLYAERNLSWEVRATRYEELYRETQLARSAKS